ncbi:Sulfatase [Botrimarina colliarenosi]|uniref:Sulfatase n=1 Tax=Botrimarina colliarenosi TaxID=2528001 RepID=A0A5C6A6W3_9BACT|nr:hypothetical protein [Botrimarina colliarenosi]TWT94083.1 Sulfatase [Botrimarina colliarenosi]
MQDDAVPTIVLAIDGLRAAALGAYGQTGYETPAFDTLAAEGRTYDNIHATTPQASDFYARLAPVLKGRAATLLTDDPGVTESARGAFGHVVPIHPAAPTAHAASIEEATMAATWGEFAEALIATVADSPGLIWIHTRGLYGPWDAPPALMAPLLDEDDPEIEPTITPPDSLTEDDDERFAASCRYAAQVMLLDACLGGLLDLIDGLFEGEDYRLAVLGLRGFPLGEHGRLGGVDQRLYSEQQHTPLFVRGADPDSRFDRAATPQSIEAAMLQVLAGADASDGVVRMESSEAFAIVTADWLLRAPAGMPDAVELYVKPDDRWEQNNIASLRREVVDELLASLSAGHAASRESAVAAPGDGD